MDLRNIVFPVFPIRRYRKLYEKSNILYIETAKNIWKIDNRNIDKPFHLRRLAIDKEERYPLSVAIFNFSQLINYKSVTHKFIDYSGMLFNYKKTKKVKLNYYKVDNIKVSDKVCILEIEELPYPFYITNSQYQNIMDYDTLYLGLLDYNDGKLLYEISTEFKKPSWRKI